MSDLDHIRYHRDRIDDELVRIERYASLIAALAGGLAAERAALRRLMGGNQGGARPPDAAAGAPRLTDGGGRGFHRDLDPRDDHSECRAPAAAGGGPPAGGLPGAGVRGEDVSGEDVPGEELQDEERR